MGFSPVRKSEDRSLYPPVSDTFMRWSKYCDTDAFLMSVLVASFLMPRTA